MGGLSTLRRRWWPTIPHRRSPGPTTPPAVGAYPIANWRWRSSRVTRIRSISWPLRNQTNPARVNSSRHSRRTSRGSVRSLVDVLDGGLREQFLGLALVGLAAEIRQRPFDVLGDFRRPERLDAVVEPHAGVERRADVGQPLLAGGRPAQNSRTPASPATWIAGSNDSDRSSSSSTTSRMVFPSARTASVTSSTACFVSSVAHGFRRSPASSRTCLSRSRPRTPPGAPVRTVPAASCRRGSRRRRRRNRRVRPGRGAVSRETPSCRCRTG